MMEQSLRSKMESDLKGAMKSGDVLLRDTLRFILAGLKNAEIDKRDELTPDEEQSFLLRQGKRMQESIEQFVAGGREDLADHERAQLAIVKRYLPAELSDDELYALVRDAIAETGAEGPKDLGKVMKMLTAKAQGRADGKRLSAAARAALQPS
jgi:uncharacterized protein YqeY